MQGVARISCVSRRAFETEHGHLVHITLEVSIGFNTPWGLLDPQNPPGVPQAGKACSLVGGGGSNGTAGGSSRGGAGGAGSASASGRPSLDLETKRRRMETWIVLELCDLGSLQVRTHILDTLDMLDILAKVLKFMRRCYASNCCVTYSRKFISCVLRTSVQRCKGPEMRSTVVP